MLALVSLGLSFLEQFLSHTKSQLPTNVVQAVEATIKALTDHKTDLITQAALESQRG